MTNISCEISMFQVPQLGPSINPILQMMKLGSKYLVKTPQVVQVEPGLDPRQSSVIDPLSIIQY